MIKKLLSTAAIVVFTSGMAIAQTTSGGTAGAGTTAEGGMSRFLSWDQTTRDAFFSKESTLRSEAELRTAWNALDTAKQDQIRADCQSMSADAGGTGTTQPQAGANTTTGTGAGSTTGTGTGTETTASTAGVAGGGMPDIAEIRQFCTHIQSF